MRKLNKNSMMARVLAEIAKHADENGVFRSNIMYQIFKDLGMSTTYSSHPTTYLHSNVCRMSEYVVHISRGLYALPWETMEQLMELGFDQSIPAGIS